MKKTLVTLLSSVLAVSAFAQGTVNVGNNFSGFRAPIYAPDTGNPLTPHSGQSALGIPTGSTVYGGPLLQGTNFTFAFYAGPVGTLPANLTLRASTTFRTAATDALPAGLVFPITDVVIPGVLAGSPAAYEIRVWDNVGGTITSFDLAFSKGRSGVFTSGPLGGIDPGGNPVLPPSTTGFTSFNITAVPEPSTFVLAGLGAAALVIFRRRK
jgi:hypothetical protein